jgi:hypothetical protein
MAASGGLTSHWSRQPPRFLFSAVAGDSLLPGFGGASSPAAAAQLGVRHHRTLMKKKILFTILWIIVFTVVTFIAGKVGFAILVPLIGMASWKESTLVWITGIWLCIFFAMPVLGLVLSVFGVLPGTRYKRQKTLT